MTPVELLVIGLVVMSIGGLVLLLLSKKNFRNDVDIARQTGKDPSDVIWIHDKFRVVNKNGAWTIEFAKIKEKTRSIDGKLWTKYLKPSSHKKLLQYTKDEWDGMDMSAHIRRGLKLYETTEGEFYPMAVTKQEGKFLFSVLDQDNRQFVINEIQAVNDLTRNKKQEVALLWGIVIGFVVLGIAFMCFMYFMSRDYTKSADTMVQICAQVYQNFINAPVNQSSNPTYLSQLAHTLGG